MFRHFFAVFFAALIAAPVSVALAESSATTAAQEQSRPLAVLFRADWCPGCKVLEPKIDLVTQQMTRPDIEFVVFDLTNDETSAEASAAAAKMGLSELFAYNKNKTATFYIVDEPGAAPMQMLTRSASEDDITAALDKAAGAM